MRQPSHLLRAAALAALLAPLAAAVQAQTAYDLRTLDAYRNWVGNADPESAAQGFSDLFNNGNLLTGPSYTGGLATPAALYSVIGGSAPVETTPGDITTQPPESLPVGRVRFDIANANAATPLVINGLTYSNQSYRLRLQDPTGNTFFNSSQTQFMASAVFGFVTPGADARYGVRFTDSNGGSFDDTITFDVVRLGNGDPGLQIRRLAGNSSTLTTSNVQTVAVSSFLTPGKTLADVSAINLRLFWEGSGSGTNVVRGRVELINVQGGVPTGLVGEGTMGNTFDIFHGETTTSFQVGAAWAPLAAVPEPGTWALMLGGVAALGAAARRRAG